MIKTMPKGVKYIDIDDIAGASSIARLAEEVHASQEPRILRRESEDLAILMPLAPTRRGRMRTMTEQDYTAFLSAAGSWEDVDADRFVDNIRASRSSSTRPPVEL